MSTGTPSSPFISKLLEDPRVGIELSPALWEDTVHCLREENLLGTLHHLAKKQGCLPSYNHYAQRHLVSMATYAQRQAQQVFFESRLIKDRLATKKVTPVFLKGAAYTLSKSSNAQGRIYSDIDVLVRKDEIPVATAGLQMLGYVTAKLSDYDDHYYREWAHEIPPLFNLARGTVIDLHHNLIPPVSGRAPAAEELFSQLRVHSNGFTTLKPSAMALHSIIHLLVNDDLENAYRDVVDLWLLCSEHDTPSFWSELVGLATTTGFERELSYALQLVSFHFKNFEPRTEATSMVNRNNRFLCRYVLSPAISPSLDGSTGIWQRIAKFLAYARGHWLKMPLPILIKHSCAKLWIGFRDNIFGKHQFDGE